MSNKRAREGGGDNPSLVHVNAALRRELSQLTADMSEKKAIPEPRGGAVRFRVIPAELSDLSAELLFKEKQPSSQSHRLPPRDLVPAFVSGTCCTGCGGDSPVQCLPLDILHLIAAFCPPMDGLPQDDLRALVDSGNANAAGYLGFAHYYGIMPPRPSIVDKPSGDAGQMGGKTVAGAQIFRGFLSSLTLDHHKDRESHTSAAGAGAGAGGNQALYSKPTIKINLTESFKYLNIAAHAGCPVCRATVAIFSFLGYGCPENEITASGYAQWALESGLKRVADSGNGLAQCMLGFIFMFGMNSLTSPSCGGSVEAAPGAGSASGAAAASGASSGAASASASAATAAGTPSSTAAQEQQPKKRRGSTSEVPSRMGHVSGSQVYTSYGRVSAKQTNEGLAVRYFHAAANFSKSDVLPPSSADLDSQDPLKSVLCCNPRVFAPRLVRLTQSKARLILAELMVASGDAGKKRKGLAVYDSILREGELADASFSAAELILNEASDAVEEDERRREEAAAAAVAAVVLDANGPALPPAEGGAAAVEEDDSFSFEESQTGNTSVLCLIQSAADIHHPAALHRLGHILYYGSLMPTVPCDHATGVRMFQLSALQGNKAAKHELLKIQDSGVFMSPPLAAAVEAAVAALVANEKMFSQRRIN